MIIKRVAARCMAVLSTTTALLILAAPLHAATSEQIQFYASPGHAAATARGATHISTCGVGDTCGLALKFDTKTVGTITVTSSTPAGTAAVIEDIKPAFGGLGVVGTRNASLDNVGLGEKLTLKFDRIVDIKAVTFFDSDHLADFYKSRTGNAAFRLTVVNDGVTTSNVYDLTNQFNPGKAFVGSEFTFTGLKNDLTVNNKVEHFSFYVGGLDIAAHTTVAPPPKPPAGVPEPGSIALFAGAMLALGAARRRRQV